MLLVIIVNTFLNNCLIKALITTSTITYKERYYSEMLNNSFQTIFFNSNITGLSILLELLIGCQILNLFLNISVK